MLQSVWMFSTHLLHPESVLRLITEFLRIEAFMLLYRHILRNNKLKALDVAEVNPVYDIQDRTARLAASLVNEWLMI